MSNDIHKYLKTLGLICIILLSSIFGIFFGILLGPFLIFSKFGLSELFESNNNNNSEKEKSNYNNNDLDQFINENFEEKNDGL